MPEQPLLYQIALTLIPGVGDINGKKLVSYCGGAEAVFRESKKNLLKIPGMGLVTAQSILSQQVLDRAAQEMEFIETKGIRPLYFLDKEYPGRLKNCPDSPILMYFVGNADLNAARVISIVGTRKASDYGRMLCDQLVAGLAGPELLVVSGLAYGIDTQAHRAALDHGVATVGILAHGLDRIYPSTNTALARRMTGQGGLLTDFTSGTNPDRENFPKRNRIVAGLADALIVVESAKKGGALITANIANSYNRDVFAVPGKVTDYYSEGCNFLIKTNKAALIQSADDIRYLMQWDREPDKKSGKQAALFRSLEPDEETIMNLLKGNGAVSLDYLVIQSKLSNSRIATILLTLEFDGLVKSLPGKMFIAG